MIEAELQIAKLVGSDSKQASEYIREAIHLSEK